MRELLPLERGVLIKIYRREGAKLTGLGGGPVLRILLGVDSGTDAHSSNKLSTLSL